MKGAIKICWLVEQVRNDLTHFVPKGYGISILDIIDASRILLEKIEFLALESFSIIFLDHEKSTQRIINSVGLIISKLNDEKKLIQKELESAIS